MRAIHAAACCALSRALQHAARLIVSGGAAQVRLRMQCHGTAPEVQDLRALEQGVCLTLTGAITCAWFAQCWACCVHVLLVSQSLCVVRSCARLVQVQRHCA